MNAANTPVKHRRINTRIWTKDNIALNILGVVCIGGFALV